MPAKPKTKPKTKTTGNLDHVREVHAMILAGNTRANIAQFVREKWQEDEEPLIVAALELFRSQAAVELDVQLGWCLDAMKDVYRKSVEIGDFPAATKCIREIAEISQRAELSRKKNRRRA